MFAHGKAKGSEFFCCKACGCSFSKGHRRSVKPAVVVLRQSSQDCPPQSRGVLDLMISKIIANSKQSYHLNIASIHYHDSLLGSENNQKQVGLSRANSSNLPCSKCGSQARKLGAGKPQGEASLLCECGKFIKWISASEAKAIAGQLNNGGQG